MYATCEVIGSDIKAEVVHLPFLRAVSNEYDVFRYMLEQKRGKITIGWLRTELQVQYDLQKSEKLSR